MVTSKYCPHCLERKPATGEDCPQCGGRLMSLGDGDLTGTILDKRYRILEGIGTGGMGQVYRARHLYIDRDVAVKLLRRELATEETAVKRFLMEAKATARLKSPYTVTTYDFGIAEEGKLYLAMELLEGQTLRQVLKDEGRLSWSRVVNLMLQALDSLAEAHGNGILHRDLKPDNLFVSKDRDGQDLLKVMDFGIAKLVRTASDQKLTASGFICGTPEYLSPEQATFRKLDARSDLYSLGIVMYQLLAGRLPFEGDSAAAYLMQHTSKRPGDISKLVPEPDLPDRLGRLVMRMLAKAPGDRPASAKNVVHELNATLDEELTEEERRLVELSHEVTEDMTGEPGGDFAPSWDDPTESPSGTTLEYDQTESSDRVKGPRTASGLDSTATIQRTFTGTFRRWWGLWVGAGIGVVALLVILAIPGIISKEPVRQEAGEEPTSETGPAVPMEESAGPTPAPARTREPEGDVASSARVPASRLERADVHEIMTEAPTAGSASQIEEPVEPDSEPPTPEIRPDLAAPAPIILPLTTGPADGSEVERTAPGGGPASLQERSSERRRKKRTKPRVDAKPPIEDPGGAQPILPEVPLEPPPESEFEELPAGGDEFEELPPSE